MGQDAGERDGRTATEAAGVIADAIVEASPAGIAKTIGALVSNDTLTAGSKLPTIRALATALGVSASTVADAWRILGGRGVITTDRRRGTTVRGARQRSVN